MTALDDMDDDSNPQQQPYSSPIQEVQANELIASLDHVDLAGEKQLDLCFVLDTTGSMGSYIHSATQNIELICDEIVKSEKLATPECLRIGLIAYRDHPPQDNTYVTKNFHFTSDPQQVKSNLKSLFASGGGDGPEAVTAALKECLNLDWRPNAAKMAVLIADAPPHGIGEYGDGFPNGSPEGSDPLQLVRYMATQGITLFMVACEPALSGYTYAVDFYRGLAEISSGLMLPLTTANLLARVIVGSALEQMDMERLIREVGVAVAERVHSGRESVDDVAKELHEKLLLRNENTKQVVVDDIYEKSNEADHNVKVWKSVESVGEAKQHLKSVPGSRFTRAYLDSRRGVSYSSYPSYSSAYGRPVPLPSGPAPAAAPRASSTSPRRVIADFKPFAGGPVSMSMAGSPPASPKRAGGAFAPRPDTFAATGMGLDEDDERAAEVPGPPVSAPPSFGGVDLKVDQISYDQSRRIAQSIAFRSMGWR